VINTPLRQSNITADRPSMTVAGFKSGLRAVHWRKRLSLAQTD
jgi:hypothetical protein